MYLGHTLKIYFKMCAPAPRSSDDCLANHFPAFLARSVSSLLWLESDQQRRGRKEEETTEQPWLPYMNAPLMIRSRIKRSEPYGEQTCKLAHSYWNHTSLLPFEQHSAQAGFNRPWICPPLCLPLRFGF